MVIYFAPLLLVHTRLLMYDLYVFNTYSVVRTLKCTIVVYSILLKLQHTVFLIR